MKNKSALLWTPYRERSHPNSAAGWIPLAVCAAAGLLLFVGVFRLMRRIIRGSMKEDFIK
ncbi:MAG: hypothetical protein FWG14_10490 [Peptococcaceae bacterium]|nr:hypothetical protein [Peptococcaceae bacterium]